MRGSSAIAQRLLAPSPNATSIACVSTKTRGCSRRQLPRWNVGFDSPRRFKSSAFYFIPNAVKESLKSSILDEAVQDDSRLWKHPEHPQPPLLYQKHPNHNNSEQHQHPFQKGSIHESTLIHNPEFYPNHNNNNNTGDPLDDLLLPQQPTRYWPDVPPHTQPLDAADPFALAESEIATLSLTIRNDLITTDHPVLQKAAAYLFDENVQKDGGKKVRPVMVLLLSRALAEITTTTTTTPWKSRSVGYPNRSQDSTAVSFFSSTKLFTSPASWQRSDLPDAQRRLAEISELIHTASLFHDDVIDGADTRRGSPAVHTVFGDKMAILAGDYLLARASVGLARLRNVAVVETMSTIIEHLVRGEVMQMRGNATTTTTATTTTATHTTSNDSSRNTERLVYYLRKNFYKTASLMANSCKSTALLGDYAPNLVDACYRYGKHVGMAFQLVDDVLDFQGTSAQLGKPALADLQAGLATAPVLFAAEEDAYRDILEPLIQRKFRHLGDVERAIECISKSSGIERTQHLARVHAEYAMEAIYQTLPPSIHRDALIHLAYKIVARTK